MSYGIRANEDEVWQSFSKNIETLQALGHNVIVIYPIPSVTEDAKKMYLSLITDLKPQFDGIIYEKNIKGKADAIEFAKKLDSVIVNKENLTIIRPVDFICDNKGCKIITTEGSLYNSGSHLSNIGVKLLFSKTDFNGANR